MSTEQPPAGLRQLAPAKVNLYLHVVGRRADGYHLLESLVVFADIGDVIEAVATGDGAVSVTMGGPFGDGVAGPVEDNLVHRAALGLQAALGTSKGARLHLDKRLPVAAGLGGGSADAAATLIALETLWGARLSADARASLALGLGADVPVCLAGRPANMSGIGEVVVPVDGDFSRLGIVLANPRFAVSTPAVFRALAGRFGAADRLDPIPADINALAVQLRLCRNDLEAPAIGLCPAISPVLALLSATDGVLLARMSGSGATCFGLYPDRAAAELAAASIRQARPYWWVAAGGLLPDGCISGRGAPA